MFVDTDVLCRVRPICSAMPMNRLLKMDSVIGSGDVGRTAPTASAAFARRLFSPSSFPTSTSILRSPYSVIVATHPGSITHVAVPFMTTAGPSSVVPAPNASMRNTGVSLHPPSKYTRAVVSGSTASSDDDS